MKKILFFIPTLLGGGAEKVLVNMVNSIDKSKFDVTVMTLCNVGINIQYLDDDVKYKYVFKRNIKGIRHLLKLIKPKKLFKKYITDKYDTIVSYLEGPTTRIVSGCTNNTKLIAWIHTENTKSFDIAFRNKIEMINSYHAYDKIICVSNDVLKSFNNYTDCQFEKKLLVIKNISNPFEIIKLSKEKVNFKFLNKIFKIIIVGRLDKNKAQARMVNIIKRLNEEGFSIELNILGDGVEKENIINLINKNNISNIKLLGYQSNPYPFIANSDLFICCSHKEGFSTTTIEALTLNVPILTTDCSGMREILGNNEYGLIVPDNDDEIYKGIKKYIQDKAFFKKIEKNQSKRIVKMKDEFKQNVCSIQNIL